MDLTQTIASLEAQAKTYQEAADKLRELLGDNQGGGGAKKAGPGRPAGAKKRGAKKKRYVSPETKAKISEKMRQRHAEKKAAAAAAAQ